MQCRNTRLVVWMCHLGPMMKITFVSVVSNQSFRHKTWCFLEALEFNVSNELCRMKIIHMSYLNNLGPILGSKMIQQSPQTYTSSVVLRKFFIFIYHNSLVGIATKSMLNTHWPLTLLGTTSHLERSRIYSLKFIMHVRFSQLNLILMTLKCIKIYKMPIFFFYIKGLIALQKMPNLKEVNIISLSTLVSCVMSAPNHWVLCSYQYEGPPPQPPPPQRTVVWISRRACHQCLGRFMPMC